MALRYFNVAGADPKGRSGQSTPRATHLIKVACETALGKRSHMQVFGTDYPTPDGTCLRDYIHVTDLTRAHLAALRHLRAGGASDIFNCGYGRGFSVLEVIEAVKRAAGRDFEVRLGAGGRAIPLASSPPPDASARLWRGCPRTTRSTPSCIMRSVGRSGSRACRM